ncbi:hypothetical protein KDH_33080 [Dictyobacter sp. S3.2.2.5]|uniref:General stress protein 17M-like domain-containing protein n=1 Tax=Dictyobacter halimunensis TaxID=3026934 RepID=A0ABQ6FQC0_9CHLR|nr:hypothetical protein KDH_33080 [Dictyobacter sp. S3.2.2.5]
MAVQRRLIVAVFNERSSAESAIEQLYNAGVSSDRISYSGSDAGNAGGGFVESIKNLFGGTHTRTPADVMHDLSNMGLAEDEAQYYAQEYATGRTIVAVHPDEQSQNVLAILQDSGGYHFHSPEGTGPAAQTSTETEVKENLPDYTQTETGGQSSGYDVNQLTPAERSAMEPANESYKQDVNQPEQSRQPVPETSHINKQGSNAPGYSPGPQDGSVLPGPTENYGQADTLRQGGTYEQNVEQVRPPEHPAGPAGPYSQGIEGTVNTPKEPNEQFNRRLESEPNPNFDYSREQRENLDREDI